VSRWLPAWLAGYRRDWLGGDVSAALVVTLLLIPQGLAYALLAGLPAQAGLYASVVPLFLYALVGKSHAQSVGPMAVTSLLTAATLARLSPAGPAETLALAAWLALLSGAMLVLLGALRFGFLVDFLSTPVLAGFTSASALLIVLSQLVPLAGGHGGGSTLTTLLPALWRAFASARPVALAFGLATLAWLWLARRHLAAALGRCGVSAKLARLAARAAPVCAVLGAMLAVPALHLTHELPLVGAVPAGLPLPHWPALEARLPELVLPAFFIALVNYVQSLSVVQWLAAQRGEPVDPDRELLALGLCNVGAGLFAGLPVTGGLSRSVVNAEAGAQTQLASLITAGLMLVVMVWGSAALAWLPLSVLAATIVIAVGGMVDFAALRRAWRVDRADAAGFIATFVAVLLLGVDTGIVAGVLLSLGSWLARAGRPHIAELGRLPGSEHFRNVRRFSVETLPQVVVVRVDESLFFANARRVEGALWDRLAERPHARRLVLVMSAVNRVDATALAMLERLDTALAAHGVELSLAEVKGPVLAVLERGGLAARFAGRLHLTTLQAWRSGRVEAGDYVI